MKPRWISSIIVLVLLGVVYWGSRVHGITTGPRVTEFDFTYQATVENIPDSTRRLELWIPAPLTNRYQSISNLRVQCSVPVTKTHDPEYGNAVYHLLLTGPMPDSLPITMTFRARRTRARLTGYKIASFSDTPLMERFLAPDSLVPITGEIATETDTVVHGQTEPELEARAIYDHVVATMHYDKSGSGWGNGDAIFACDSRRGNCTDIHSLLIGMARAAGVPARFVIGFPLPHGRASGRINGYHCWAELYIRGRGWIPVDASEAIRHPELEGFYYGDLDADRVAFTKGRDIPLPGGDKTIRANYLVYPYTLLDGQRHDDVTVNVSFQKLTSAD